MRVAPGTEVHLDAEAEQIAKQLEEYKAVKKDAEELIDAAKKELANRIGDREFGRLPGGGYVRRQIIERKSYVVQASSYPMLTVKLHGPKRKRGSK